MPVTVNYKSRNVRIVDDSAYIADSTAENVPGVPEDPSDDFLASWEPTPTHTGIVAGMPCPACRADALWIAGPESRAVWYCKSCRAELGPKGDLLHPLPQQVHHDLRAEREARQMDLEYILATL